MELTYGIVLEGVDAVAYCTRYRQAGPMMQKELNPYPIPGGVATEGTIWVNNNKRMARRASVGTVHSGLSTSVNRTT